jgi:peptidoglycan LD-endopeptidase CwlK
MYRFGIRSKSNLQGVDSRLVAIMEEAITNSPYDFAITEGLRTRGRQEQLVAEGKSQTRNSKHLVGKAVDVVILIDGVADWDFNKYKILADHIKAIAALHDVAITWGGDWKTLKDGPHFELKD